MSEWIPTASMLPPFEKRVLLAYVAYSNESKGGQEKVYIYTLGALHRDGWITDEGMLQEDSLFDRQFEPEWWMRIEQVPPF